MTIVVTGATGHLGRLTVQALLRRGVPADQIVATGRQVDKLDDLAARGVHIRRADYTDPASLRAAFAGADKVLLVSSSEVGQRAAQHANAIDAAKDAGVSLLAYTSIPQADTSTLLLAAEHRQTEQLLADSGVPHVLLRNGWYVENYTGQLPVYLEHGIAGAAGDGKVSPAPRADFAEAAATVLVEDGHPGKTYELGGHAVTMTEVAQIVSDATGQQVTYTDMAVEQYSSSCWVAPLRRSPTRSRPTSPPSAGSWTGLRQHERPGPPAGAPGRRRQSTLAGRRQSRPACSRWWRAGPSSQRRPGACDRLSSQVRPPLSAVDATADSEEASSPAPPTRTGAHPRCRRPLDRLRPALRLNGPPRRRSGWTQKRWRPGCR